MADQMFMFAITAGFMIGLGIILGIARGRRSKTTKTATTEVTNEPSYSSSSSTSSGASQEGRRVKRYNSEGKPVYE